MFKDNVPIYVQIATDIKQKILSGFLKENEKLPSIREHSISYSVTVLTVQRAIALLENEGIIKTKKGIGSFVEIGTGEKLKNIMVIEEIKNFIASLIKMGLSKDEISELIKEALNDIYK
ncbi:MAG: GntR family transcriptional regulator [Defluviitaleaceae bacterium]|nr:GntR family transcriptional regulator [Defluviitaleaceae bacterium]